MKNHPNEPAHSEYRDLIRRIETARDLPARESSFERFARALRSLNVDWPTGGRGVILVAGTNGKGSVSKTLETLLSALDSRVGLFTSPHMMETTERIRSHGRDLTPSEFVQAFRLVEPLVERESLSHFEILTLMMAEVFFGGRVRPRVSNAVIEVGVGGRLDPTRLIPHAISIVTRIGLDHQELLGGTLSAIAREKFAIADGSQLLVFAPLEEGASRAVSELRRSYHHAPAKWIESPIYPYRIEPYRIEENGDEPRWIMQTPWGEAPLALMGERAVMNSSLALTALREGTQFLNLDQPSDRTVVQALDQFSGVRWPCRMERFLVPARSGDKGGLSGPSGLIKVYLSGDHNVQGVESLREIIRHLRYERLRIVAGITRNKSASPLLEILSSLPRARLTLTLTPFRTGSLETYGDWLGRVEGGSFVDPEEALEHALAEAEPNDIVLVTGSLYLAGHLRRSLLAGRFGVLPNLTTAGES